MMETEINMEAAVPHLPTTVHEDDLDVDRRLAELGFGIRKGLLAVRNVACGKAAEGTSPFFPLNGSGTLAYQYGTRELRQYLDTLGWQIDNAFGTSGTRHPSEVRLAFYQNVDAACDRARDPHPRTKKGAGAERLDQSLLFEDESLPTHFDSEKVNCEVWYLMVAENGAVELTRAVVRKGKFEEIVERLFIENGDGFDVVETSDDLPDNDVIDFDVPIVRR